MAAFRAEGERDPQAMAGRAVGFDVVYVRVSQRSYGFSTMHAGGTFAVLHVAFPDAPEDTMPCQMPQSEWPPAGVKVGDVIHVEGLWSFDRVLRGGLVKGGGPLEVHGCKVTKR